jgi:hypothetical protein
LEVKNKWKPDQLKVIFTGSNQGKLQIIEGRYFQHSGDTLNLIKQSELQSAK